MNPYGYSFHLDSDQCPTPKLHSGVDYEATQIYSSD